MQPTDEVTAKQGAWMWVHCA